MLYDDIWSSDYDYTRLYHMVFTDDTSIPIVSLWAAALFLISKQINLFCNFSITFHARYRCETAAGQNITKQEDHINTSNFYFQMGIAQFGAWSSFAASVGLTVFALHQIRILHQIRNMKASMYLERQRLVNDDAFRTEGVSDVPNPDYYPHDSP